MCLNIPVMVKIGNR